MDLGQCPYCTLYGLVVTIKVTPGGFAVSGKCSACGYTVDSRYAASDVVDDLPCESSVAEPARRAD